MQITILVADNGPEVREFYRRVLEERGYKVYLADAPESARQTIATRHLDLILIDRRLTDDDPRDRSGEALAIELIGPTPILIFTDYDLDDPFEAAGRVQPGRLEYVNKRRGYTTVLAKIEQIIADHVQLNPHLVIEGYQYAQMVSELEPSLTGERFEYCTRDMEQLFRHLFRLRNALTLTHLPIVGRPFKLLHAAAPTYGGYEMMYVLYGLREQVALARQQYERYGLRHNHANLLLAAERRRYGGLVFDAMGSSARHVTTMRELVPGGVAPIWRGFVETTLRPWYRGTTAHLTGDEVIERHCADLGVERARLAPARLAEQVERICAAPLRDSRKLYAGVRAVALRSNGTTLAELPAWFDLEALAPELETFLGLCNAQLDLDAILVNRHTHQSWLLDFSAVEPEGLLLLPFVRQEIAVKQQLLDHARADLSCRLQLERALAQAASLDAELGSAALPAAAQPALAAVEGMRQSLAELINRDVWRAYQSSLLLATLALIAQRPERPPVEQHDALHYPQLLLGACAVFQALQPARSRRPGLWYEREARRFWLDGRAVELAEPDMQLLRFLAATPGEWRTLWEVMCELEPRLRREVAEGGAEADLRARQRAEILNYRGTLDSRLYRIRQALRDEKKQLLSKKRDHGLRLRLDGEF